MQAFTTSGCSFCTGTNLQYTRPQARQQAAVSHYVLAKATTKASDFRRLTTEEIDQQVQAAKRSLMIDFRVPQVKSQVGYWFASTLTACDFLVHAFVCHTEKAKVSDEVGFGNEGSRLLTV